MTASNLCAIAIVFSNLMRDPIGRDVIPTAEMCDALAAQLSAIEDKQIRFKLEYASNAGSHEPPADELRPDDLGPGFECSSVIAQSGEKIPVRGALRPDAGFSERTSPPKHG